MELILLFLEAISPLFVAIIRRTPLKHLNSRHWLLALPICPLLAAGIVLPFSGTWAIILFFTTLTILTSIVFALLDQYGNASKLPLGELWRTPINFTQPPKKDP